MRKRIWLSLTLLIAVLLAIASAAGAFVPGTYARESPLWAAQGIGQDLVDLFLVVPVLFGTLGFLRKGSYRAVAIWQGILVYLVYSYLLYSFFVRFNALFLVYVAILGLSVYTLIGSVSTAAATAPVARAGRHRGVAAFMIACAALFSLLWLSEIIPSLAAGTTPPSAAGIGFGVNPVHVLDLALILPAFAISGVLLLRRDVRGLRYAPPLLVFMVVMGISILGMFASMWVRGMSVAVPPAVLMALAVVAAGWLFLRLVPRGTRSPGK